MFLKSLQVAVRDCNEFLLPTLRDKLQEKFHDVTLVLLTWPSGYCYLNKGECNLNQSKDDSFVERVTKNNS